MIQPESSTVIEHPAPTLQPDKTEQREPPPRRGRSWLVILVLLLVAGGAYYYWMKTHPSQSTPAPEGGAAGKKGRGAGAIPIVAVKAQRGSISLYVTGLGGVAPIYTVTLKSRVDGQLMSLHYKEGELVKQGDLLLEIDPRPYQVQLTQYEGQLRRDQALLQNAKVDMSRYETLLKQNAVAEQQLATQKSVVEQDEGIVRTDEGLIASAALNLTYCKITAPITGRIGLRLVDPGNIVHASDPNGLLVITQAQPISVIFTIAEDQLPMGLQRDKGGPPPTADA